jgi:hypothetical protein
MVIWAANRNAIKVPEDLRDHLRAIAADAFLWVRQERY